MVYPKGQFQTQYALACIQLVCLGRDRWKGNGLTTQSDNLTNPWTFTYIENPGLQDQDGPRKLSGLPIYVRQVQHNPYSVIAASTGKLFSTSWPTECFACISMKNCRKVLGKIFNMSNFIINFLHYEIYSTVLFYPCSELKLFTIYYGYLLKVFCISVSGTDNIIYVPFKNKVSQKLISLKSCNFNMSKYSQMGDNNFPVPNNTIDI